MDIDDDFDLDALDNLDFDSAAESNINRQAEKNKKDAAEIESLKDGADDCGGACAI